MCEPTAAPGVVRRIAGVDYPADVAQLRAWFAADEDCLDYVDWLRWPQGFRCPHCGHGATGRDRAGRYRCGGCRRQVSVTAGTIFDKTRIPLTVWFEAIWLGTVSKSGVSAAHLHRVLPVSSYQSAWLMLAKIRQVMSSSTGEPLEGHVEVDETFLGGPRAGKTGRGTAGKTLVAGAIEVFPDGWGRARLAVISDASATSLRGFVRDNVRAGSTVVTDHWVSYLQR